MIIVLFVITVIVCHDGVAGKSIDRSGDLQYASTSLSMSSSEKLDPSPFVAVIMLNNNKHEDNDNAAVNEPGIQDIPDDSNIVEDPSEESDTVESHLDAYQKLFLRKWTGCSKQATKTCKEACQAAVKSACKAYECRRKLKKALKKECSNECRHKFGNERD